MKPGPLVIAGAMTALFGLPAAVVTAKPKGFDVTTTESPWLLERDFGSAQTLHSTLAQTVVLDLEPASRSKTRFARNTIRFLVEEPQAFSFCLPDEEEHVLSVRLKRTGGGLVINSHRKDCKPVTLTPGSYTLDIFHDTRSVGANGKIAFLHRPAQRRHRRSEVAAANLSGGTLGTTYGGTIQETLTYPVFFALYAGEDASGRRYPNTLTGIGPTLLSSNIAGILDRFVWSFYDANADMTDMTNSRPMAPWLPQAEWTTGFLPLIVQEFTTEGVVIPLPVGIRQQARNCPTNASQGLWCTVAFVLNDVGNGAYKMWADYDYDSILPYISAGSNYPDANQLYFSTSDARWGSNADALTWRFTFIGYPAGTTMPPLQEGQFAVYGGCNFQGTAFVFDGDADYTRFGAMTDPQITPPNPIHSIKLGPSTYLEIFKGSENVANIGADVTCATDPLQPDQIDVFVDVLKFIATTKSCINCNLAAIDFSGDDFTGVDFSGAILTQANLANTVLAQTNLTDANLDSIIDGKLAGADFTGATLGCTSFKFSDLTPTRFGDNIFIEDQSCYVELGGATLEFGAFPAEKWRYLDLSSSTMLNVPPSLSTVSNRLDLSGARLSHVTWLTDVQLDGVNLGCHARDPTSSDVCPAASGPTVCATLQDVQLLNTSLKYACLAGASLEEVSLLNSNLDGADLSGAQLKADTTQSDSRTAVLDGAFMRGVNLSGADLTGISAQNISFFSTSTGTANATGITAPDANFSGAYMVGADFSGQDTNLQSTTWTGAVLVNTDFDQADLSPNTSGGVITGTATTFKGAYMHGATFDQAQLAAVNFLDTYWDADGSGGKWNFLIPKANLRFRDYWKDPALPECPPSVTYNGGNVPPMNATDDRNTCPDGRTYAAGCDSVWGNPDQDIGLAFFPSAVPPAFPQDPTVSADLQCSSHFSDPNPEDFCWITTNNPAQCPENPQ